MAGMERGNGEGRKRLQGQVDAKFNGTAAAALISAPSFRRKRE